MRQCTGCNKIKALSEFSTAPYGKDKLTAKCRSCYHKYYTSRKDSDPDYLRNIKLKNRYNITAQDFDRMLKGQKGVCYICYSNNRGKTLHVDHCHETGQVRRLLCSDCNRGLGCFRDDPEVMRAAITYLKEHKMNDLVEKFMTEYRAKVEADGREAAHTFADEELLPSLTEGMDDDAIKALQEELVAPVTSYLFALAAAEDTAEVEDVQ